MSVARQHRRRFRSVAQRLRHDANGAYAVEFAFAGSLFIVVSLVLCQYAMVYMARESLTLALDQAVRTLLTGVFQQSNAGSTNQTQILQNLKAVVCGPTPTFRNYLFRCSDIVLDVRVASSFSASSGNASPVDGSTGTWAAGFGTTYSCPGPKSIAVVRAAVKYPLFARGLSFGLSAFTDGSALLQSAAVFRIEPYQSGSGSAC
ncbi:pilus assembly protein [Methylobacterium sp. E-005]|uniref:TadE/TadG family type IV pilus assembly protein n=1 Tax=Methylobacterium sp. E-005 TaxID=2836549 RepID=UPI001FB96705|nr:TadE/TadG family type IV pilus assembly protein [Methylobacterium sp. E-005]MCJ2085266.1 pilus assembly protein [Methylobacterium sp. E-005]